MKISTQLTQQVNDSTTEFEQLFQFRPNNQHSAIKGIDLNMAGWANSILDLIQ